MPSALPVLAFGGDYNPEQWPREVWQDDVRLMQRGRRQPRDAWASSPGPCWSRRPGEFDFGWLDEVHRPDPRRRHQGGPRHRDRVAAAVARPGAIRRCFRSAWTATMLWPGGRQAFCPSSPVYREHALRLCRAMAERYGDHDGPGPVARGQRAGLSQRPVLLRRERAGLPRLAGRPVRGGRPAQRSLGDRLLVPALRLVRRGASPAQSPPPSPTPPSSWTSAGSPPTSCSPTSWPSATCCASCPPASR